MNAPNRAREALPFSEFLSWILAVPFILAVVVPLTATTFDDLRGWLLHHRVVVEENVLVALPSSGGVGLDLPRVAVAGLVLVAVVCIAVLFSIRRRSAP